MWTWKVRRTIRKLFISIDWSPLWFFCAGLCGVIFVGSLNTEGSLLGMLVSMAVSLVAAALFVTLGIAAKIRYEMRERKIHHKREVLREKHAARLKKFQKEMRAVRIYFQQE